MEPRAYLDRLDATTDDPGDLFEHFERRAAGDLEYHALPDARHGVERGTVVVGAHDAVVRGYPSVPRVLVLDPGLESFFPDDATVVVEEKLDGFNVRIARVDGDVLAFTRSGYVCPFSTARARELLAPDAFFEDHPTAMLCVELVGPETPYTTHDYDDVETNEFRVFDVRDRDTGEPLSVAARRDVCERYDFPVPRQFGRFAPADASGVTDAADATDDDTTADVVAGVRDAIEDLDAAGREGVIAKSADGASLVKYTTGAQHRAELAHAFSLPFEYGREFLFSRVLREAFQAAELTGDEALEDEDELRERARDLGESILLPAVETIRDVERGDTVGERFTVREHPATIDALFEHFRDQSLTIEVVDDRWEDGQRVVEFVKVAESTQDRVDYYLAGGTRDE